MKQILISLSLLLTLFSCETKKDNPTEIASEWTEDLFEDYPVITLENADSAIIAYQKEYERQSSPTTLTVAVSNVCYVRIAVDSLTTMRYYKASARPEAQAAVQDEYKCWLALAEALDSYHQIVIIKNNDDDPWKFFYSASEKEQLYLAHTNMLSAELEQLTTCLNRADFKVVKADPGKILKKLKVNLSKYEKYAPSEYKNVLSLLERWYKVRSKTELPLPYYHKDKNTEVMLNSLTTYIQTLENYVY